VKSGLRDGAEWFLQKRLMKRFQHNLTTARDLKWMIRDLKYNRRKQALRNAYGRDQWFRGRTQRQAELTRRQGVDGSGVKITPKRLTILIRNLGQQYVRRKNRMNLREELERISGHEARRRLSMKIREPGARRVGKSHRTVLTWPIWKPSTRRTSAAR
jgi:hypothetical protein